MRMGLGILVMWLALSPGAAWGVGSDKFLHAGVSVMLAGTANTALYRTTPMPPAARMTGAFCLSMTLGLAKELRDQRIDGGDLVADAVGSAVGVLLSEYVSQSIWTTVNEDALIVGIKRSF